MRYHPILHLTILLLLPSAPGFAQNTAIDSLKQVVAAHRENDSVKAQQLFAIATEYLVINRPEQALRYTVKADKIATTLNNQSLKARSFEFKAHSAIAQSNYHRGLYYKLEELKIVERMKDSTKMPELMSAIASLYDEIGDWDAAIRYGRQSVALKKFSDASAQALYNNILGYLYIQQKKFDHALPYYQNGLALSRRIQNGQNAQHAFSLYGIGRVQFKKGQSRLAETHYRKSLEIESKINSEWREVLLMLNYAGLAEIFASKKMTDSAVFYYERSLVFSESQNQRRIETLRELADLYEHRDLVKANKSLRTLQRLSDSIYNREKINSIQNLTFNEVVRQQQIQERLKVEAEERRHNLQYAAIAILITIVLAMMAVLSHSVAIGQKGLKILGVVGLLLTFEFINLLIHPHIAHLTHHSPVGMLSIMVAIAALLVPLHHKVEHWAMHKMLEKNQQAHTRLAQKIREK